MDRRLYIAKTRAMSGSVTHLEEMVPMVLHNQSLLWEALPAIYRHLPPVQDLPSYFGHQIDPASDMYRGILAALALLKAGVSSSQLKVPKIAQSIKGHWATIWAWCGFLIEEYIARSDEVSEAVSLSLHSIPVGILTTLSAQSDLILAIASTPGLMPLLLRLWRVEMSRIGYRRSVVTVLIQLTYDNTPCLDIFLANVGDAVEAASVCVRRMAIHMSSAKISTMILREDIAILTVSSQRPDISRALLANHFIAVVSKVMSRLTSHSRPFDDDIHAARCLHGSSVYLSTCIEEEGLCRVITALDGRVLMSIFKSADLISKEQTDSVGLDDDVRLVTGYVELLQRITPYLVYRSVLQRAKKALKTIKTLGFAKDMGGVVARSNEFWQAWNKFIEYAQDRIACKEAIAGRRAYWTNLMVACHNPAHPGSPTYRDSERHLEICQGCHDVYFCSRECQRVSWNHGHREECESRAADIQGGSPMSVPGRERAFACTTLLIYDLPRHREKVSAQKAGWVAKSPSGRLSKDSFIIEMNYSVVPFQLTVTPSEEFQRHPTFTRSLDPSSQSRIRNMKDSDKESLILSTLPNGRYPAASFHSPPVESLGM